MTQTNQPDGVSGTDVDTELNTLKAAADALTALMATLTGLYQRFSNISGESSVQPHLNAGQVKELRAITLELNQAMTAANNAINPPAPDSTSLPTGTVDSAGTATTGTATQAGDATSEDEAVHP